MYSVKCIVSLWAGVIYFRARFPSQNVLDIPVMEVLCAITARTKKRQRRNSVIIIVFPYYTINTVVLKVPGHCEKDVDANEGLKSV